jgi:hypothetical protein
MQAGLHLLLVRVVLLDPLNAWVYWHPFLTLCRLADRKPMEFGAAMLCGD